MEGAPGKGAPYSRRASQPAVPPLRSGSGTGLKIALRLRFCKDIFKPELQIRSFYLGAKAASGRKRTGVAPEIYLGLSCPE